jgi:WD40 repeat protein
MRQIGLLPAGCHQCDQIVIHASDEKLIFASKLALYVLNAKTYAMERIISCQARSIVSLSVNSYDMDLVACSGVDGTVCVWNISSEEVVVKCAHPCNSLAWDPHDKNKCALLSNYPKLTLHIWDTRPSVNTTQRLYVHDSDNVSASVLRWNPHILGQLAIGCSNGVVYIFDCEKKKAIPLKVSQRTLSVVDIQWDRLSAVYMIVAYQSFISLWDTEVGNEVHIFEKQSTGISCLAWMDWTAGNFVSSNPKTGEGVDGVRTEQGRAGNPRLADA